MPGERKRLRIWIESYFQDGTRMSVESIELDRAEVLRLFSSIADHLEVK